MSKYITEDDISLGYSSEPDEYESEHVQNLILGAEPYEIYVGNTGKVCFEKFFALFKPHGFIKDMSFWRTHDHLFHCRISYRSKEQSDKAIKLMNNRKVFSKRIRVTYVKDRVELDYASAIRIDDICADITEEDIFDHFISCGDIRFVIKTGSAAYIQFASPGAAAQALRLEMILNGDPYTMSRISADDRIDHIQLLENMKDIKYRKPFVMVENYPELPKGTPLFRYKNNFESVGPVRHFKIAPTANGTVTLALCMDKADDRDLVIDRFNDATISDKRLKLYMAPGKARMTVKHVTKYAICKNSISVDAIRPYYKEFDVCMLFRKCGSISFLEKVGSRWIVCFDDPAAVSLARSFHVFSLYKKLLVVDELNQQTLQAGKGEMLEDPDGHVTLPTPTENIKKPNKSKKGKDDFLQIIGRRMDENIKQNLSQITKIVDGATKQQALASQAKRIDALFKMQGSLANVKATPLSKPKQPANDNGSGARKRLNSANDQTPVTEDNSISDCKFLLTMSNLPKGIEESDLRELFRAYEMKQVFLYCSKDLYHPTSFAYIRLTSKADTKAVLQHHHDKYRGKRVCIQHNQQNDWVFLPERSVMLKNLSKNVTEEDIMDELEKLLRLKAVDVLKPAHHYAYVDFTENVRVNSSVLNALRNALTRFKIDVFPLYKKLPKMWRGVRSHDIRPIAKVRAMFGAMLNEEAKEDNQESTEFGVHNAHKLFIGNIARDTQAEDVIDYFNNFGSVIDYAPIEKKSCYLRKSAILSFVNSKHAQNAYVQQPHHLEGSILDVHLMDCPPQQFSTTSNILTVKFHSPFLTNDEIRHHMQNFVNVIHHMRFDAFDERANFVVSYKTSKHPEHVKALLNTQYINDEAVKIVQGYDLDPPTDDEAREKKSISHSPFRQQKEKYLSFVVYKENLKDDMEVRSKPNKEADIPFKSFYNDNSVQINNVSLDTTLEQIRDLFIKCGDIVDYSALILEEDATKICYVKFKIDLAADLACTYNQRMLNGKRILVHLAKETLHAERDRSVLVERLNPSTTTEDIHDAFTTIGTVKYVQKQSPFTAIVCFKNKDCVLEAVNVAIIPKSRSFIINPCYEEYDPRIFNNFSCQEEFIPIEMMRAALRPRILPEFHQLELDRQVFESLPNDIKSRLINEVFLARDKLPNFNNLSKPQQLNALKTQYQDFSQKEHFLRLTPREQEKLLEVTSTLQQEYPYEEVKDLDVLPPAPKLTRNEEPANNQPDKVFASNWYSSPSEAVGTSNPYPSEMGPMQQIEPLVTAMNASHVAQALPTTGLLRFPGNNIPPWVQMRAQSSNMYPQGGSPQFRNMYPQQGPPEGMPSFGGPMGPGPSGMLAPGPHEMMGMGPPMGGMQPIGSSDSRWMQQRMAAMAYNAGPEMRGPMEFGGFNRPPFFN